SAQLYTLSLHDALPICEQRRAADVVVGAELAGLKDDFEVRAARANLFDADDLVVDLGVAAGEERAAVDDHVDLVRAGIDDLTRRSEEHTSELQSRVDLV